MAERKDSPGVKTYPMRRADPRIVRKLLEELTNVSTPDEKRIIQRAIESTNKDIADVEAKELKLQPRLLE